MGVYAHGALEMSHGIPSLMPTALDPELSRGHPLLYYFLAGWNFKIFGSSVIAGQLFSLFLTNLLIVSVFQVASRLFNPVTGMIAAIFLGAQQILQAQATLLLPEVLLALTMLWAWYGFVEKRYWIYLIAASAAVLTKETGLFIVLALGITWIAQVKGGRINWKELGLLTIPIGILLLFLQVQRMQQGWYLFPYHTSILLSDFGPIWEHVKAYVQFAMLDQGRWLALILLVAITIKSVRAKQLHAVVPFFGVLFLVSLVTSTFGVYLDRYVVYLMPFLAISSAWSILYLTMGNRARLVPLVVVLTLGFTFFGRTQSFQYDASPNFKPQVEVMDHALKEIVTDYPSGTVFANFPLTRAAEYPEFGYVSNRYVLSHLYSDMGDYLLIAEPGSVHGADLSKFAVIKQWEVDWAKVTLYKAH
jgi:4-amino-4-deoxy-L-arabinose transferase-like glycosyltransferase